MPSIQLYATGSATGTSVAQVTIPSSGRIAAAQISLMIDAVTDNAGVRIELSRVPANQIATNGAVDPIMEIGSWTNFATSGLSENGKCLMIPLNVSVRQGEIVYVHATVTGTATYYFNAILIYG